MRNASWTSLLPTITPNIVQRLSTPAQSAAFQNFTPPMKLSDPQRKYNTITTKNSMDKPFVGLMRPRHGALKHPAAQDLLQYATDGCPVDCGKDWTLKDIETAIAKGPSTTARSPEAAAACRAEAFQKVKEGHCRLVSWNSIKHNPPKNLKISPIAAIPHKSRQYRMILNLAYKLRLQNKQNLPSVNDTTNKNLAPQHSMYELGNVIPRFIWSMAAAPDNGVPLLFSKIDLKDGYWRMVVNEQDAWNFAYVLPQLNDDEEIQLVIPDALQMGWSESPAFFCAATETARDLADTYYTTNKTLPKHTDEKTVMNIDWSKIPVSETSPLEEEQRIVHLLECYIDDFIAMIQCTDKNELTRLTRCMLTAITNIFPPPSVTGSVMGPAISSKKLEDEGAWETRKEILGWVLNGIHRTIQLPPAKCDSMMTELRKLKASSSIEIRKLQSIQGKLQFASIGIPLGKPLLGPIDEMIARAEVRHWKRIKINKKIQQYCNNWKALLHLMKSRPSHVRELIKQTKPAFQGLVDASKWGVGGVWFRGTKKLEPFVWFFEWPDAVRTQLCTSSNPTGSITISDLELLGILMHWLALEKAVPITELRHTSPAIWCDNISAVTWIYKFRTNVSPLAANILTAFATRLHVCQASILSVDHISGVFNTMADVASRKHTTNPLSFLKYFTSTFQPPKNTSWHLFRHSTKITCKICSELLLQTQQMGSWRRLAEKGYDFSTLGPDGLVSISPHYQTPSKSAHSRPDLTFWWPTVDMLGAEAFQLENTRFVPKRSRWHSAPSPRPCNWTENLIPWQQRKAAIQKRLASFWRTTND